ncbi:MAG: sodium/proton-translocating pyrophosphatase [Candidatus Margulisiibacteriota bacterium]
MDYFLPRFVWLIPVSVGVCFLVLLWQNRQPFEKAPAEVCEASTLIGNDVLSFLKRHFMFVSSILLFVFLFMVGHGVVGLYNPFLPFAFVSGGFLTGFAGYFAARKNTESIAVGHLYSTEKSWTKTLKTLLDRGLVSGLMTFALCLLGIVFWYFLLNLVFDHNLLGLSRHILQTIEPGKTWDAAVVGSPLFERFKMVEISITLLAYGLGSSVVALFVRSATSLFAKAADTAADTAGYFEASLAPDDARNPALFADAVGDHAMKSTGVVTQLFESFTLGILGTVSIGLSLAYMEPSQALFHKVFNPILVGAVAIFLGYCAVKMVAGRRIEKAGDVLVSFKLALVLAYALVTVFLLGLYATHNLGFGTLLAIESGFISSLVLTWITLYVLDPAQKPVQAVVASSFQSEGLLKALGFGFGATFLKGIVLGLGFLAAFVVAGGTHHYLYGIYGISFASFGLLLPGVVYVAFQSIAPVADTASMLMAAGEAEHKHWFCQWDSLGNTLAGNQASLLNTSLAFSAITFFVVILDSIVHWIQELVILGSPQIAHLTFGHDHLTVMSIITLFRVDLLNPMFMAGLFLGGSAVCCFVWLTIRAIHRVSASALVPVREALKQDRILNRIDRPHYAAVVDHLVVAVERYSLLIPFLALVMPVVVGGLLGVAAVCGFLLGSLIVGVMVGGAALVCGYLLDNVKLQVAEQFGTHSYAFQMAQLNDGIGDYLKDAVAPLLHLVIKLFFLSTLIFAGIILKVMVLV